MWAALVIYSVLIVLLPIVWYWVWRGQYRHARLRGTRLENARRQTKRWIKFGLPAWGMMLLGAIEQTVELYHVSGKVRLFWQGFVTASSLFLIGSMIANLVALMRDEREKRRQQAGSSLTRGDL